MRSLIATATIVMVASLVQVDRISYSPLLAASARTDSADRSQGGQDRVATVVGAARKALGGEDKLTGLKSLTAEGPFRRSLGGRDLEGT
jgi:hypothetical protein